MAKQLSRLLVLPVLCGICGCMVNSEQPIVAPNAAAEVDKQLFGVWRYQDDEATVYVHAGTVNAVDISHGRPPGNAAFFRDVDEQRLLKIVTVIHERQRIEASEFIAYAAVLGEQRYLNIYVPAAGERAAGFAFVRYALPAPDRLQISKMDADTVAAEIRAKKLLGTASMAKPPLAADFLITAPSVDIAKFLPAHDLFAPPIVFTRVKN